MKACILSYKNIKQSKYLYERLIGEMKKKFDSVFMIPVENVSMNVDSKGVSVRYRGTDLEKFDAILPRIGPSYINYGYLILKTLEGHTYFPNKPEAYLTAADKFRTLIKLAEKGIPIPKTAAAISREIAKKNLKYVGEPIVVKIGDGCGGKGVVYGKDIKSTNTIIDAVTVQKGSKILVEEFLPNPGEDVRLFVVGDEVQAAAKRVASKMDIRSNIHAGGKYETFQADEEMKKIAVRATKAIGADICGVDILVSDGKPYVLECNMNPGFFISTIAETNLFHKITDYIYEKAREFYSNENTVADFIAKTISFVKKYK